MLAKSLKKVEDMLERKFKIYETQTEPPKQRKTQSSSAKFALFHSPKIPNLFVKVNPSQYTEFPHYFFGFALSFFGGVTLEDVLIRERRCWGKK